MQVHVQRSVAGCFAVLRQLRSIRRFAPSSVYQSLVVALVLLPLDYGNATLAGLHFRPAYLTVSSPSSTQRVGRSLVSVARSLSPVHTGFKHPSASSFNWRSLSTELFTALHGAPQYLWGQLQYVADLLSRRGGRLRSSTSILLGTRYPPVGDRSFAAAHDFRTVYLSTSSLPVTHNISSVTETHLFRQSYHTIAIKH